MNLLTKAYRDGWIRERKLAKIWRAIARRQAFMLAFLLEHEQIHATITRRMNP